MANSVYSEVTSVSTQGFEQDRILDKLKTASSDLPYTVNDITISHNDFAVSDVYNNSIRKLYNNYLFLIANAELPTKTPPTSAAPNYLSIADSGAGTPIGIGSNPAGITSTNHLSALEETHIALKTDSSDKFLYFNYSPDSSVISETDVNITSMTTLISGNEVEFNKTFKFKNVVSVDIVDNLLFVLDKGSNTAFKFDITGLITDDAALRRTGISDTTHPGRYLLKTIGGEGTSQTKNKLIKPSSLSVYKNRVYILDNGHNSIKVFDLNFNFIKDVSAPNLFNNPSTGELVSIVVDQYSDTNELVVGYVLSSKGKILEYDVDSNTLSQPRALFNFYDTRLYTLSGLDENDSFKKIVNSKAVKNILYICNNGKIYKYYKSNLNQYIGVLNLAKSEFSTSIRISGKEDEQQILSFDTVLYNNKDYIAVTTRVNSPQSSNQKVSTYVYEDEHVTTKLYNENLYTNYFTLSDILVLPQEIVNNITFNKTTKKLIYNHYSLFENLNKKVYSFYDTNSGTAAVPTLCTVNYHEFTKPTTLDDSSNLYIGVNEPLLTDVINRPLKLLYSQQESLFDLIKEEPLNNNPPDEISIRLPANTESFPNVLSVAAAPTTVDAGDSITMTVTRENVLSSRSTCSFKYYTTLDTNTSILSSDISYIGSDEKSIGVFEKDENTKTITIDTVKFFSGGVKKFSFIVEENSNCVIDPSYTTVVVTVEPIGDIYTVSMSATSLSINEGSTGRVAVKRYVTGDVEAKPDEDIETSVNISITNPIPGTYTPVVTGSKDKNVVNNRYADFFTVGYQQDFAEKIGSTSTVFFTDIVTSVVFDISAVQDLSDSPSVFLEVEISNPSAGSIIDVSKETVSIGPEFKTTNLFLSSISATYRADGTHNELLSCVNIWEALSASTADTNTTAFSTFSATNPYNINFTVNSPLSVFSVSTVSAAVQFTSDHDLVYSTNQLNIIVDDTAAIVGKGGAGGHGYMWASGSDFTQDGTGSDDLSAFDNNGYTGGPAIGSSDMGTYFDTLSFNNSGIVYGGAGGGGGGVLGVSASNMPNVQYLSGGCGGGGGAGIHAANYGTAGLAAVSSVTTEIESADKVIETTVYTQHSDYADIYLQNGSAGSGGGVAGAGGGFSTGGLYPTVTLGSGTVDITTYPAMTGLSGGGLGQSGYSDSETIPVIGSWTPGSSFGTVSSDWARREGGEVGPLVDNNTSLGQIITAGSTGTFSSMLQ